MQKGSTHCAVDAPAEQQQHLVVTYSVFDVFQALRLPALDRIVASEAGYVEQEILQHCLAISCQIYFWMELDTIQVKLLIAYAGTKGAALSYRLEVLGYFVNGVTVG